jgi:hypothetical protein
VAGGEGSPANAIGHDWRAGAPWTIARVREEHGPQDKVSALRPASLRNVWIKSRCQRRRLLCLLDAGKRGVSVCSNEVRVPRASVENLLLTDLRTSLRDPATIREACQRARKLLRTKPTTPSVTPAQVQKVEQEISNLTDAIASGLLKFSPALAERLRSAEAELDTLRADQVRHAPDHNIEKMVTGLEVRFEGLVADFERALIDRHGEKGQQEIRNLLGQFKVEADESEIRFYNEQSRHERPCCVQ